MRVLQAAIVFVVVCGLAGPASAQSLGELAAKEKQKRQGKPAPKVITETDLSKAGKRGTVSMTGETPVEGGETTAEAPAEGAAPGAPGAAPAKKEKTEEELRAEQRAAWEKSYAAAKEKVRIHQLNVSNIQKDMNDVSGGLYTERRNTVAKMLADEQAALTAAQAELDRLDNEGRANGWPRG
jgi:hypothetical protein